MHKGLISAAVCVNKKNLSVVFPYSEITVQLIQRRQWQFQRGALYKGMSRAEASSRGGWSGKRGRTMNACRSFLEAMEFKGLPFHFSLGLKYKGKKREWREGEKLRQQNVSKRGSLLLLISTCQIDRLTLPVNQQLLGSRLLL